MQLFATLIIGLVLGQQTGSGTGTAGRLAPPVGDLLANGPWLEELRRDITGDAVDPNSDKVIALHRDGAGNPVKLHLDFAGPKGPGIYGTPYNVFPDAVALSTVSSIYYASESDAGPAPIDLQGSFQGEVPGADLTKVPQYDRHYIALLKDKAGKPTFLWEAYQPVLQADGSWKCTQLSKFDLLTGTPRPLNWTSADAAGLPMLPLILKPDEVLAGDVGHAIRCTFSWSVCANRYVWPARHKASVNPATDLLPFGGRLRLRKDWYDANAVKFTGQARVIVDGMRKYGLINADVTGPTLSPFVGGVTDDRWTWQTGTTGDTSDLMTLQTIPVTAFEMVSTAVQEPVIPVAYKTIKDGAWSDPACYTPAGVPGPADTVTFAHNLTIGKGESWEVATVVDAGGSISVLGGSLSVLNAGSSSLGRNVNEPLRQPLAVQAGGTLKINGILPVLNNAILKFQGTATERCTINGTPGTPSGFQSTTTVVGGLRRSYFADAAYTTFNNVSLTHGAAASTQDRAPLKYDHCTFTSAPLNITLDSPYTKSQVDFELTYCRFLGLKALTVSVGWSPLPVTTGTRLIAHCSFEEKPLVGAYQDDIEIRDCYFGNSLAGHPSNRPWKILDGCLLFKRDGFLQGENTMGGSISNSLHFFDGSKDPHQGLLLVRQPTSFTDNVVDVINPRTDHNAVCQAEGGIADHKAVIARNIFTAGSGTAIYTSSPPNLPITVTYEIANNVFPASSAQCITAGYQIGQKPGTIVRLANNIVFGGPGVLLKNTSPTPDVDVLASGAMTNNVLQVLDPQFRDPARHVWTWAASLGATGTPADLVAFAKSKLAVQFFPDDPSYDPRCTTAAVLQYLRDGYAPTNPAVLTAGDDGKAAGAIDVSVVPPPPPPPDPVPVPTEVEKLRAEFLAEIDKLSMELEALKMKFKQP